MGGREFVSEIVIAGSQRIFPFTRTFWISNAMVQPTGLVPDGSQTAPFNTIQAALDAAGPIVDLADQIFPYTFFIAGGFYDEDLVVPNGRSVDFVMLGTVALGDGVPPTTPRTITIPRTSLGFAPISQQISFSSTGASMDASFLLSGGLIATSTTIDGLNLQFRDCTIEGPTVPCVDVTGYTGGGEVQLSAIDTGFFSADAGGAGIPCIEGPAGSDVLEIVRLTRCRLESSSPGPSAVSVIAGKYAQMVQTQFDGDLIFTDPAGIIDDSLGFSGFFNCAFGGFSSDFTGNAASDFQLDGTTNFFFKASGGSLGGGSTKDIQTDLTP